jgi:hypothetical protein
MNATAALAARYQQETTMFIKLIGGFGILATASLLATACGEEPEVDISSDRAPAVVEHVAGWPVTADGQIRRALAELEAERADRRGAVADLEGWPLTADGQIRRALAELEAERAERVAADWGDWPATADGAIRRELARLEAEGADD